MTFVIEMLEKFYFAVRKNATFCGLIFRKVEFFATRSRFCYMKYARTNKRESVCVRAKRKKESETVIYSDRL
jgi:hypothetical protein